MHLREIQPHPALANIVLLYRIIDFEFQDNAVIPPKAYTPRPEQCLQFFPTPTLIEYIGTGQRVKPKNALLIGQHTVVNNRTVFRRFLSLQVVFRPGALYRLTGLPMHELANQAIDAEDIFGNDVANLNDLLYHAKSHAAMVDLVERYLLGLVRKTKVAAQPIDNVTRAMLDLQYPLDRYVADSFVCHRQFDRKFIDRVGIGPKEYMRVIRFDQAYRMKNSRPNTNWFNIAIACGYYDLQHLSKDFKLFTGYSPSAFFAIDSPERVLGSEEVY